MKALSIYSLLLAALLIPSFAPLAGTDLGIAGKYFKDGSTEDYLEFKVDGTFTLHGHEKASGTYTASGHTVTFTVQGEKPIVVEIVDGSFPGPGNSVWKKAAAPALSGKPGEQDTKGVNPWATALGGSGAQAVFTTYMSIAELADLYGAKTYDKAKATQLATMYQKLTESSKDSLTDLISSGKLNKDDESAVQHMVVINDLLGKTAKGVIDYINESTNENEKAYDKNRQKAWKALSKFLGIEGS